LWYATGDGPAANSDTDWAVESGRDQADALAGECAGTAPAATTPGGSPELPVSLSFLSPLKPGAAPAGTDCCWSPGAW
jgi:hypothetical protein